MSGLGESVRGGDFVVKLLLTCRAGPTRTPAKFPLLLETQQRGKRWQPRILDAATDFIVKLLPRALARRRRSHCSSRCDWRRHSGESNHRSCFNDSGIIFRNGVPHGINHERI